ncbi:MAG: hypothetical protein Q8R47_02265 [Nanoarchaeota archaeon]|nr:hypothetical protein [Nanoarchaeota archaeon]
MNIGVDVDEVLAELMEAYLQYHNQNYNTNAHKKDMFSYSYREVFGGTEEEHQQRVLNFFKTEHFQNIKPVPGALKTIQQLTKEHQLCIITARPHVVRKETEQWLSAYFADAFHCINLTNQWHGVGKQQLKSEIGKEQKISVMIDDSLKHALDCASQGMHVLLADFNYPWNQSREKLPENIKRVHSWKEIVAEINNYGKNNGR